MNRLTVIIPSKTRANLDACLAPLAGEADDIIVVDDGVDWHPAAGDGAPSPPFRVIPGVKPFCFARNCNIGIRAAGDDDVILLNDDAILETPGGFRAMQQAAADFPGLGVIGATTNNIGNRNQFRRSGNGVRQDPRIVCFFCVLIPRRTIERVGLLDERFNSYGFDDDDYCYRVRQAGLGLGISDACYLDHARLRSTFRGAPGAQAGLAPGQQIFIEKWGAYPL